MFAKFWSDVVEVTLKWSDQSRIPSAALVSSLVFSTVYQEESCVLLYTLYFMEISLSISVKPARGYIQVSKNTRVRFVSVMITVML